MDLEQFPKLMLVIIHKVFSFLFFLLLFLKNTPKNTIGVYTTSKVEYAEKYCQEDLKVFVIGFVIIGNPFPVIEHPFQNKKSFLGKSINPGYQSHFTLGNFLFHFSS